MTNTETVPYNFDEIYQSVAQKFADKGYDIQEGSNVMQLATSMSYLISMLNVNTSININETILTLARKRENALQDARLLGYEASAKTSYQYTIKLILSAGQFILPRYTEFTANGKKYYYLGSKIELTATEGQELEIIVKEGTLIKSSENDLLKTVLLQTTTNNVTSVQNYVDIPFTDVEENGIDVFLTYYDDSGILYNKEQWYKIADLSIEQDTLLNKKFVRLDNIDYKMPRIYFNIGGIGTDLRAGTLVETNILITSGSLGEMTELPTSDISAVIDSYTLKYQGTDEENINSIKNNAPLLYNSGFRAITKTDYTSISNRHPFVSKTAVWDGNQEYPKVKGKIWLSFVPQTKSRKFSKDLYKTTFNLINPEDLVNWYIEPTEINVGGDSVFSYLNKHKVPTMELVHRHPVYLDFEYTINILRYDINVSESLKNNNIFNIIDLFFQNEDSSLSIENFESTYFQSNLSKRIDTELTDITGFNLKLENYVILNANSIVDENSTKKILIPLGLPFEEIIENVSNDIIVENLPSINTTVSIANKALTLDTSSLTPGIGSNDIITMNIKLNTDVVGTYTIYKNNYILVTLNVDGVKITESNIIDAKVSIKYPSDNIKFEKNVIPRLRTVSFK